MCMISVIIPALNEQGHIERCIRPLAGVPEVADIIVADGGSTDATVRIAAGLPKVTVINAGRGRGHQMNAGASRGMGGALLFLHADTVLADGWAGAITSALADRSVAGGAFSLRVGDPAFRYRLVEGWVRFRCSAFRLPYGDQGIFIRRNTFEEIGGYSDIPLMEDVELAGRMKKAGRLVILRTEACTSERRWAKRGFLGTVLQNQMTMLLYRLGVSPAWLAGKYYS